MQFPKHARTSALPETASLVPNPRPQSLPRHQSVGALPAFRRASGHPRSSAHVVSVAIALGLGLSACSARPTTSVRSAAATSSTRAASTTTAASVITRAPTTATPAVTSTTAAPANSVGIDYASPQAVCDGFTATIYASNAVTDAGYGAAYVRADPYVTVAMMNPPSNNAFPSAQWDRWVAHQAHAVVTVTPASAGHPPDTPTTADRGAMATVQAHGANGWIGTPAYWTVFCTLAKGTPGVPANQWRVASIQEQEQPPAVTTTPPAP